MNSKSRSKRKGEAEAPTPDPSWERFASRHAGHPSLEKAAVYALPTGLIKAIRKNAPALFTDADADFERELSEAAGTGFFLRRRFRYPLLGKQRHQVTIEAEPDEVGQRARRSEEAIHQLLVNEMRERGLDESQVESHFKEAAVVEERVLQRQRGYAGWLVTDAKFRRRRDAFQTVWSAKVEKEGRLPRLPFSFDGTSGHPVPQPEREFFCDFTTFYQDWAIDGLQTWELPLPLRAELVTPSFYSYSHVSEAGLLLFVPWYLLRDKDIRLHELAAHRRMATGPAHLGAWLDSKPKNWGYERFSLMLELYVYIELSIKQRYAHKLVRQISKLEFALGEYFSAREGASNVDAMAETVRKVRQKMNTRLKST